MINSKILFFTVLIWVAVSYAQETVLPGGEINGNQSWQGIIRIQGDIIIQANSRVTIQPGTQVLFEPGGDKKKSGDDKTRCEIIVRGSLVARGQANNKILFSSSSRSPRMSDWYGIQFLHSKSENMIDYSIVEYGYNGITVKNSNITVSNSEIRYNYNAGIRTEVKASPTLFQNIISENGYAGVICELGARPILTENLITGNPMGVVILSLSQPNLGSVKRGDDYNPGKNQFLNNEEYDIYNHSSKPVLAQNNTWGSTGVNRIAGKIYDNADNNKFGKIEFQPVFNSQAQQSSLNRFLALAQDTQTPAQNSPPAASQNRVNAGNIDEQQNLPPVERNDIIQQIDSTMAEVIQNQNQVAASPLIAAANLPESADNRAGEIEQVDYNRIFLEPFIDTGRKKILKREEVMVTSSLINIMTPGTIRVKVIVNQQGHVESASILRGINEMLDELVLDTVREYIYEVGTVNGVPVRFSTTEVFRFQFQ